MKITVLIKECDIVRGPSSYLIKVIQTFNLKTNNHEKNIINESCTISNKSCRKREGA